MSWTDKGLTINFGQLFTEGAEDIGLLNGTIEGAGAGLALNEFNINTDDIYPEYSNGNYNNNLNVDLSNISWTDEYGNSTGDTSSDATLVNYKLPDYKEWKGFEDLVLSIVKCEKNRVFIDNRIPDGLKVNSEGGIKL